MNTLFVLLWAVDLVMFAFAVESTLNHGVNGMVLFASEYAILMASALNSMARYILSVIDYRRARARGGENAPPMENKSMYIFYIELFTDFLKLITYLTFFMLIMTFYGLPLNIIRDVYLTARSFITRLRALIRYHNATRDMDRRYPDATEAELSEMSDRTCIICREEMYSRNAQPQAGEANAEGQAPTYADGPNMTAKKLPCGHIFHFQCLRSWLERQQSCPTCRRTVLETNDQNQNQAQAGGRQAGARPVAPQAGAVPQAGQAPAGVAMGWLNNLFGVPPPGAAAQGHFGNMQGVPPGPAPGQPQPQNFGWPPAQPPLYYQLPPNPHLPPAQPVPPFRGFYGPGGVWQAWGVDPRWFGNGPQQPAPAQAPAQPANTSSNEPTGPSAEHRPATQADSTRGDAPPPTPTTSSDAGQPSGSTPRDAAAQAALRRTGLAPPNPTTFDANPSHASTSAASATSNVPAADAPSGQGEGSRRDLNQAGDGRRNIPSLIPLYDLFSRSPPHLAAYTPYGNQHRSPLQAQSQAANSRLSSQIHQGARSSGSTASTHTPLAQLPATLTEQQLARLDHVTREAIDERLRVLEGVSGVVYRCIEELTRVRSVLPAPAHAGPASASASGQAQAQERPAAGPTTETAPREGSSFLRRQHDAVAGSSNGAASAPAVGPAQTPAPAGSESSTLS
ncbi:hypothetical protein EVJ58_g2375 [Rhodofomes roseus]|uniref:RING-type E3 ubiquitin transferase n=1 Tax=Rhodofomes roseus TaxID=34475 RepID=A0A4Y9YSX0_9APHY|nr:hypothetical protein EVJ58_g2375 [Rhodofomes roseus]